VLAAAVSGGCTRDETVDAIPMCSTDLEAELEPLRVPGLAAGVVADGRVACTAVAGMANIEEARPVAPDTVFAWASVSKTVTGTAALVLLDEGRLDLDDDIDAYLPFSTRNPNCPDDPITFRQLLTHSSSIVDNDAIYSASYTTGDSPIPLGDFVRDYVTPGTESYDADANFARRCPGEIVRYSNVAVGLLGHAIEQIAGMPFDRFCRERIFSPLGMDETSFHLASLPVDDVAMPYDGHTSFTPVGHVGFPTYPDGLLRTSAPHLARFLAMTAELGEYEGTRILAEETAREIQRLQIPDLDDTQGLVWYYDFDDTLLGHDGEDPGTSSLMYFDPVDGAGVVLVANGDWYRNDGDSPEAYDLLQTLLDEARR
jgi:CubicO group peptidase (beta-lactamase class C family)